MLIVHAKIPRKPTVRGFTTAEILVSLAIIAVLTAVVMPVVTQRILHARTSALSQTLFGLSQGIAEYKKAVSLYPGQLTLLTTTPTVGVATDACGNLLTQSNINNWRGPYVSRQILSTGIPMGDGLIQNSMTRTTSGTSTVLLINTSDVDTKMATDLEADLDNPPPAVPNPLTGTVRYTTPVGGQVTLSYSIPISGC